MNYYSVYSILTSTFSKKTGQKLPAQYDHIHNKNLVPGVHISQSQPSWCYRYCYQKMVAEQVLV